MGDANEKPMEQTRMRLTAKFMSIGPDSLVPGGSTTRPPRRPMIGDGNRPA